MATPRKDPSWTAALRDAAEKFRNPKKIAEMKDRMTYVGSGLELPGSDTHDTFSNRNWAGYKYRADTDTYVGKMPDGRTLFATVIDPTRIPAALRAKSHYLSGTVAIVAFVAHDGRWVRDQWTPAGVIHALSFGVPT